MERKKVERRTVLKGGVAAIGTLGGGASAATIAGIEPASADTAQAPVPEQILTAVERFRATIPANFDPEYVEKAVIPFFLTSFFEGERPMLPMIDVNFSKENALPYDFWGLISHDWRPSPEEGVTVFLQALEKRGDNNLRKRIYFSAVTPDLYKPMYSAKVNGLFRQALGSAIRKQAVYAALPRLLFRHLLGPSPRSYRRRHSVRSSPDWRGVQYRPCVQESAAADYSRQLYEGS